jgi:hypothetical protein
MRAALITLLAVSACQDYDMQYQRRGTEGILHEHFTVQQPSKADILFVVDNSGSMREEQNELAHSIDGLLDTLAPRATSYRIGITSTDVVGFVHDCNGQLFAPELLQDFAGLSRGDCNHPEVRLRWPHDGVAGRLIAAYDETQFQPDGEGLRDLLDSDWKRSAFLALAPTGVDSGPIGRAGESGVPWVIDRDLIQLEACTACGCIAPEQGPEALDAACAPEIACFDDCAGDVAAALVRADFRSSLAGLGTMGLGYEQGLTAALESIGVDPLVSDDAGATSPLHDNLTMLGHANAHTGLDATGAPAEASWLRDDALLAVMFLSDEEDCSMPSYLADMEPQWEDNIGLPAGSMCYQADAQPLLLSAERLARLAMVKKSSLDAPDDAHLSVGFIGGARPTGPEDDRFTTGVASDCRLDDGAASNACTCLTMESVDLGWCDFTQDASGDIASLGTCDALAGNRYLDFVDRFSRRTIDAICQDDYKPALIDFADRATVPCFELDRVLTPADLSLVRVYQTPAGESQRALPYETDAAAGVPAWSWDSAHNAICLEHLERIVGDTYDFYVLTDDSLFY